MPVVCHAVQCGPIAPGQGFLPGGTSSTLACLSITLQKCCISCPLVPPSSACAVLHRLHSQNNGCLTGLHYREAWCLQKHCHDDSAADKRSAVWPVSKSTQIWETHPQLLCAGNIRTVDYAGPYNLSLLSVQADEIQGDSSCAFCDYIKSCAHCLEHAALCLLCFAQALKMPRGMHACPRCDQ